MKRHQHNKHFLVHLSFCTFPSAPFLLHLSFWRKKTESTYTIRQYLTSASTEWRAGSFAPFADKLSSSDESSYRKCGSEKGRDDAKFSVAFAAAKQIYAFVHHITHTQSLWPINAYHIIYKYQDFAARNKSNNPKEVRWYAFWSFSYLMHQICIRSRQGLQQYIKATTNILIILYTGHTNNTLPKVRFAEHPNSIIICKTEHTRTWDAPHNRPTALEKERDRCLPSVLLWLRLLLPPYLRRWWLPVPSVVWWSEWCRVWRLLLWVEHEPPIIA